MTAYAPTAAERLRAAVPVAAVHALLGLALLSGLRAGAPQSPADGLKLIDLPPPAAAVPPPPPPPSAGPSA
ncbi:MAG: hypothetical protein M3N07_07045, partial [Pseudomonadota bacterium]|nr:hypothetical protein [Pseudomonadota bacterium]